MDEDIDEKVEEGKVDLLNPVEAGTPPEATGFSMAAQKDEFLGGGQEKQDSKILEISLSQSYGERKLAFKKVDPATMAEDITSNIKVANTELMGQVFKRDEALRVARQTYVNPAFFDRARIRKEGTDPEEVYKRMRSNLDRYIQLATNNPDYQGVLNAFRTTLPETFYLYRGQIGDMPAREIENYTVSPSEANFFAMDWGSRDEEKYNEGAVVVRDLVQRDQVVALGLGNIGEVIIKSEPTLGKAA